MAKEDNSDEDEEDEDDEDEERNVEHDHIHGSAKRMAIFPDVTFIPTEELKKGKGKQEKGKEGEGKKGEGKRPRSSETSGDWLPVLATGPIQTRAAPKRRRAA